MVVVSVIIIEKLVSVTCSHGWQTALISFITTCGVSSNLGFKQAMQIYGYNLDNIWSAEPRTEEAVEKRTTNTVINSMPPSAG